jgi:hypothetical protein
LKIDEMAMARLKRSRVMPSAGVAVEKSHREIMSAIKSDERIILMSYCP